MSLSGTKLPHQELRRTFDEKLPNDWKQLNVDKEFYQLQTTVS